MESLTCPHYRKHEHYISKISIFCYSNCTDIISMLFKALEIVCRLVIQAVLKSYKLYFRIVILRTEVSDHVISIEELRTKERDRDISSAEDVNTIKQLEQELMDTHNECETLRATLKSVDDSASTENVVLLETNKDLTCQ